MPNLAVAQRHVEHVQSDRRNVLPRLDQANKRRWRKQAMLGVLPTNQGLHATQAAVIQGHLGLEITDELTTQQRQLHIFLAQFRAIVLLGALAFIALGDGRDHQAGILQALQAQLEGLDLARIGRDLAEVSA